MQAPLTAGYLSAEGSPVSSMDNGGDKGRQAGRWKWNPGAGTVYPATESFETLNQTAAVYSILLNPISWEKFVHNTSMRNIQEAMHISMYIS